MKIVDVHMANTTGLGAEKFANSILNELIDNKIAIDYLYLSAGQEHAKYPANNVIHVNYLFKIVSRTFEIFSWKYFKKCKNNILILGDLPLNTPQKQYILCHQSLLFSRFSFWDFQSYKFLFFRLIFILFLKKDDVAIVQSQHMKNKFNSFFKNKANVVIMDISSKNFGWPKFRRAKRALPKKNSNVLNLIYPAANYPHKNHEVLNNIRIPNNVNIYLTIKDDGTIYNNKSSIIFLENLDRDKIYDFYKNIDGLIFLSSEESLGMPLAEAIICNLPIICPKLEYSSIFFEIDGSFQFDLNKLKTLEDSISFLHKNLDNDWWPDWDFNEVFKINESSEITNILLEKI